MKKMLWLMVLPLLFVFMLSSVSAASDVVIRDGDGFSSFDSLYGVIKTIILSGMNVSNISNYGSSGTWSVYAVFTYVNGSNYTTGAQTAGTRTWTNIHRGVAVNRITLWGNDGGGSGGSSTYLNVTGNGINQTITQSSSYMNVTAYPFGLGLKNVTYYIWYTNGTFIRNNFTDLTGSTTNASLLNPRLSLGSYLWNAKVCANETAFCSFMGANATYTAKSFNQTYNTTSYDTANENFFVSLDNEGNPVTSATLTYNGISYSATVTNSGTNTNISKNLDVSAGTNSFSWQINYQDGTSDTTTGSTQTVSAIYLTLCNSTITQRFLNMSFKDESTLANLNATVSASTFNYWLGTGTSYKTYTFTNDTGARSYTLCFSVPSATLNIDSYVQYAASGYPQRVYDPTELSFNNITTNKTLYLLSSSVGQYVTFQVINAAEQPLEGVAANATREIGGENVVVGQGTTGADGGVTFWLNPDYEHTFSFSLSPYPVYTTSLTPSQSEYTVTLGSLNNANVSNYNQGISYSLAPSPTALSSNTYYLFNLSITSSYWALEGFGFNITNASGYLLGSASSTGPGGGSAALNISTGSNRSLYVAYYWIINSTTTQASRPYTVIDFTNNDFSITRLISDFTSYVGLGFFGLTDTGVGIIIFLVIVMITGTIKVKYGLSDEALLAGIIFSLVALFDVGFGLIPNPVGAVSNFPTIFMGIIFAGAMFKEVFQ